VPAVLVAAEVAPGRRVIDVGTGDAALITLPVVGASGLVIGTDCDARRCARPVLRRNLPARLAVRLERHPPS